MESLPQIPDVEIGDELGHGAFSVVYRARYRGEKCALKIPRSKGRWTRWVYREAVSLARVKHPGLPAVLEVGEVDDAPYLIMELVEGATLNDHLVGQTLGEAAVIELAIRLTGILDAVHAAGLVHRDVKPRNIVVEADGRVRLVDFGFATPMERRGDARADAAGTPGFAAPEQFDAPARVDGRADLFAVGRVITTCLASTRRERDSRAAALGVVLDGLLAPNADDRYPDARALLVDLERVRDGQEARGAASYERTRHVSALVGRARELQRVTHAWAQIDADGAALMVRATRGGGKTHFLQTAVARARSIGSGRVYEVAAQEDEPPLASLRRLVTAIVNDSTSPLSRDEHLVSALGTEELCAFAKVIVPNRLLSNEALRGGEPTISDAFAEGAAEILLRLGRALERAMFVVDDFQWVDPVTRDVLVRAASRAREAPVLFVFGERSRAERRPGSSLLPSEVELIGLPSLTPPEVASLIRSHLGVSTLEDSIPRRIATLGDGTPLGILEVLGAFLDAGALRPHAGTWTLDVPRADRVALPAGALALLGHRVADIPQASRRVLEAAAIIGAHFDETVLAAVVGVSVDDLDYALADGRQAGLVERSDRNAHRFVHDSLREKLLEGLDESARRRLHQSIGEMLMAREASSVEVLCAAANHLIAGEVERDPQRVYRATRRAATAVFDIFDYETCLRYLDAARSSADRAGIALDADFHRSLGEARLRVGAIDQSVGAFEAALDSEVDPEARAEIYSRIAWVQDARDQPEEAWQALEKAFAALGRAMPVDTARSAAQTLRELARSELDTRLSGVIGAGQPNLRKAQILCALHYQNVRLSVEHSKPLRLVQSTLEARRLSKPLGRSQAGARAKATYGFVIGSLGRREAGLREIADARAIAASLGDSPTAAFCLQLEALTVGMAGDLDRMLALTRECVDSHGHWLELNEYCRQIANADFIESLRGRPRQSWVWLSSAFGRLQRSRLRSPSSTAFLIGRARAALATLGRDAADDRWLANEIGTLSQPNLAGFYRLVSWGPRARFLLETNNLGSDFEALVAEFAEEQHNPRTAYIVLAEYYVAVAHARIEQCMQGRARGREPHLRELQRAAADLRASAKIPLLKAHSLVTDAYVAWFEGSSSKATKLFAEAEDVAHRETCAWVLFAVSRARCFMLREQGRNDAAQDVARVAELLARTHGAEPRARIIREEAGLAPPPAARLAHATTSRRSQASSRRIRRQLASILHVVKAPVTDVRPDDQAALVLDNLLADLDADSGFLWFEPEGVGASGSLRLGRNRAGETITEQMTWTDVILRHVREVRVSWPAVEEDPSFGGLDVAIDIRRVLAIPLFINDVVVGAACLQRRSSDPAFNFEDRELFDLLSSQVPISLEICRLMAEREQLHKSMQHMQKMDAVGRLAAGVAHDFNNTLSVVTTSVAMLREHGNLTDYAADDVTLIADATQRATDLAKRLLAFSRHQPGPRTRVDPNVAIAELGPLLKRAMVKDHRVETRFEATGHPVDVDRATFDAAIINLAVNARDAMDGHGAITITTRDVILDDDAVRNGAPSTGPYIAIDVTDTGRGIPPENLSRIFEPFFTTKGPGGGTGLGLTMVYAFAKNSGGCIFVESKVGKGTTFRVCLPRANLERLMPVAASNFPRKLLTPNRYRDDRAILLVDDDPGVRESVRRVLLQAGYRVLTAGDAVEALGVVSRVAAQISLVILDVMMPGMTGPELAQKLLTMNLHAKILFVSGYAPSDIPVEIGSVTNEMLLQKPFAPAELLARVDELTQEA